MFNYEMKTDDAKSNRKCVGNNSTPSASSALNPIVDTSPNPTETSRFMAELATK